MPRGEGRYVEHARVLDTDDIAFLLEWAYAGIDEYGHGGDGPFPLWARVERISAETKVPIPGLTDTPEQ